MSARGIKIHDRMVLIGGCLLKRIMATVKKQIKKKTYTVLKDIDANQKCPPQQRLILDTIKAAGGTMSREDLMTALKRPVEQGGLKTNQTAERIFGFYKPTLVENGILQENTETTEVEVEVPDKPAKKTDAAAAGTAPSGDASPATPAATEKKATGEKHKGAKGEPKAA